LEPNVIVMVERCDARRAQSFPAAEAVMTDNPDPPTTSGFNRRSFIAGAAGTAVAPLTARAAGAAADSSAPQDPSLPVIVMLEVNGANKSLTIDARTTLLDALREHTGLTGSKKGCDHGQCGACTVLIDGRRVLSCLTLALAAEGQKILTVEGLAKDNELHPMQQAFIDQDAFQCGYCTPGQIVSAVACVQEGHANSDDEIREYMSGNICRCAAYPNIVAAVKQAAPAISSEQKG
jgi:xanthine dehydrogenase YagT iron-sulfur-binding subunit